MKRTLLFMLLFTSSLYLNVNLAYGQGTIPQKEVFTPIDFGNVEFDSIPRSIPIIPFEGYYYNGDLYFTFTEYVGMADIIIVNQTTNRTQNYVFDTTLGQLVCRIGDEEGLYLIYIVTEDGTTYCGTLNL